MRGLLRPRATTRGLRGSFFRLLRNAIVVWSWSNERSAWERFTVAGKFSRGMAVCAKNRLPISVVLRDKHYAGSQAA